MDEEPIRLFVAKNGRKTAVSSAETLAVAGLATEEQIGTAFGDTGYWIEMWLHEPTFGLQKEIRKRCRSLQNGLFVYDDLEEPGARCAVMVKRWNGVHHSPDVETFEGLHPTIANAIDAEIQAFMYPSITADPNFIEAWRKLHPLSAQENQSE